MIQELLTQMKEELNKCDLGSIQHAFISGYIKALQDILERGLYND